MATLQYICHARTPTATSQIIHKYVHTYVSIAQKLNQNNSYLFMKMMYICWLHVQGVNISATYTLTIKAF